MRLSRRWGALALAAAVTAGMMSGCSRLEDKTESETVIAAFDGEDIMMDYVMYQMRSAQYGYEQLFGVMYGTTDFWSQDYGDGRTIEAYVIDSVMASIRQTKVLCDYAEKNGITLSEEQQKKVDDAIAKALEDADEEYRESVGMTEELLKQIYTENAIANLAYMELVADVDTTIGDDEFIRKDFTYVKLTPTDLEENSSAEAVSDEETSEEETGAEKETAEEATTEEETTAEAETTAEPEKEAEVTEEEDSSADESGTETVTEPETTLSDEQETQKEKIAEAADEIREKLEDGEAPADFISDYNENATYFTATQSTVTIGAESTYVYTAAAFALSADESVIYEDESSGAVYILLCTNDNNEEARQDAIDTEISSRKAALFAEKYESVQNESPKFSVDEDVMAAINFSTPLYMPETTEEITSEESSEAETGEAESTDEAETAEEESTEAGSTEEEESTEEAESTKADK